MVKTGHTILQIFGISIRIAPSWLLIAALITWSLAEHSLPAQAPDHEFAAYLLAALATMVLFFASLLMHELAHALVAKSFGLNVPSITLFLFGGVAELGDEPDTPGDEFWIAIAGPIMSFVLAIGFWFLSTIGSFFLGPLALAMLFYLAAINLVLAVFNLLPAFPLDGGRVLRAYLWARHGDVLRATEQSARMGEFLAFGLIGLGLLGLFQGAQLGGAWQIMIGLFILFAARSSIETQRLKTFLGDQTVADLMTRDVITTTPDKNLSHLVNRL
ncbi:MAG: site-2 protease family protein, partial [Pseudomonadota bacterium]